MARVPSGHPLMGANSVTHAPGRTAPEGHNAGRQSRGATVAIASLSWSFTRAPTEKEMLRATRPAMNEATAPAVSARTRTGWTTSLPSSPGRWPARHCSGIEAMAASTTGAVRARRWSSGTRDDLHSAMKVSKRRVASARSGAA